MSGEWEMSEARARIAGEFAGKLCDAEMNALFSDLLDVLHDFEWWYAADITEHDYRESVRAFKQKWISRAPEERVRFYADLLEEDARRYQRELGVMETR